MILENLHLDKFKNYSDCSFSFSPKLNFIFGENGNGKTNILEAISVLCYSKSFLMNSDSDCVMYGRSHYLINGEFKNDSHVKLNVKCRYNKEENEKELIYGTEKITRLGEFIGNFPLVVLSPQDMKLTSGTPQDRRRNFDLLISQVSRIYLDDLRNYNRVIKQKNALLKSNLISKRYTSAEIRNFLESWNEELVLFGVKIMIRRLDFLEEFKKYVEQSFESIVGSRYIPFLFYESDIFGEIGGETGDKHDDAALLRKNFSAALDEKMDSEIKRGISLAGPHRDNYIFRMRKDGQMFDVRAFASQGEHKTFVVSLKLSEFEYIKSVLEHTNKGEPVLLLDDVFSELDKTRISKICGLITKYNQVFITTTDYEYLETLKNYFNDFMAYRITNGTAALVN